MLLFIQKQIAPFIHKLLLFVYWATHPIFRYLYENKKILPPVDNPILLKSGSKLAKLIRSRKITAKEAVNAFITRIEQVNCFTNAVVSKRYEEAIKDAERVDNILAMDVIPEEYSEANCPFLGVPITVKEAIAVQGMPFTSGLIARKHVKAEIDADCVKMLRNAGVIVIASTNISELCMWYESHNLLYGRSCNAYHLGRIVGGSSGGEGCIQSVAGSAFGVGADIGGSIRMPAFFNGVFGHKATSGVVSNEGQFPMEKGQTQMLSTGPLCRYAEDLVPFLKVVTLNKFDKQLNLNLKVDVRKLKYFYMKDGQASFANKVHPEVELCVSKAADHFKKLGCEVKEINLKSFRYSLAIWVCKMTSNKDADRFSFLMGNCIKEVNPFIELLWWCLRMPRHTLAAIGLGFLDKHSQSQQVLDRYNKLEESLRNDLEEMLSDDGVFLYPTHPLPAPYHNQPLLLPYNFSYTGIFNCLGLPVTAVPMGLAIKEKVPVGLQVTASRYNDRLTCAVALELEKAFGGWIPPGAVKE